MLAVQLLGWAGSALLVYSVLQTRVLRLRVFNGIASLVLVTFNAIIAVWPMVAVNAALTVINVVYIVRLLRTRHDARTFHVVPISPREPYLSHLLQEFDLDIQRFNPGFSSAETVAHATFGFVILTRGETVGLVVGRDGEAGSAQIDLDYVVPRYRGFTLGEFVYRPDGPLAARGYRTAIAPPLMRDTGHYLSDVGFRRVGSSMIRNLT